MLEKLKNLFLSVEKSGNRRMITISVIELGNLVLAAETLRMVAGDMAILKATLTVDRGRVMVRNSDLVTIKELTDMISISVDSLDQLGVGDIYAEDIGEFVSERIRQ